MSLPWIIFFGQCIYNIPTKFTSLCSRLVSLRAGITFGCNYKSVRTCSHIAQFYVQFVSHYNFKNQPLSPSPAADILSVTLEKQTGISSWSTLTRMRKTHPRFLLYNFWMIFHKHDQVYLMQCIIVYVKDAGTLTGKKKNRSSKNSRNFLIGK